MKILEEQNNGCNRWEAATPMVEKQREYIENAICKMSKTLDHFLQTIRDEKK